MARPRLLVDEDVSKGPLLAAALRQRGFDAVAAQELGKTGLSDEELLTYAAAAGRVVLTFNIKDFVRHAREWEQAGKPHMGVVVSVHLTGRQFGELLRYTMTMLNAVTAEEMQSTVRFLQEFRTTKI